MNRLRVVIPAISLLVASLMAPSTSGPVSAAPTRPPAGATPATPHTSTVRLHATTSGMARSAGRHRGSAADYRRLQHFVNRSLSPRPRVVQSAQGVRRLASGARPAWLPVVAPHAVATSTPGAVKGWAGLNEAANQKFAGFSVEPPDQGLCAGGGHVLEMINLVVRVYSPNGKRQGTEYMNRFFREPGFQFTSDPSCVYDRGSGRYYATEIALQTDPQTGNLLGPSWIDLAVSKTKNPGRGWNIYRIQATDDGTAGTPAHTDCPCIPDFPHLGTDAHGVFVTTNEYPFVGGGIFGNNFNGAQVYALSKRQVSTGAASLRIVHFDNVLVSGGGPRRGGFTLWPAQAAGAQYATAHHGTIYFASSMAGEEARPLNFTGHSAQVGLWWIGNTASLDTATPNLTLRERTLRIGSYGIPPLSNQRPGPVPLRDCIITQCAPNLGGPYPPEQEGGLDSSDTRPMTAVYVHHTVISALDTAMRVGDNLQAGFEWFRIHTAGPRSRTTGHGYVGVANGNAIYPAIATNTSGRGYVGFTIAGADWYPSAGYTTMSARPGRVLHVAGVGAAPEDGQCEYLAFNCAQTPTPGIRPRWGDYGYAAWDGRSFFVANEYIAHRCTYRQFARDHTCGGTRSFLGNFSTHIQKLR